MKFMDESELYNNAGLEMMCTCGSVHRKHNKGKVITYQWIGVFYAMYTNKSNMICYIQVKEVFNFSCTNCDAGFTSLTMEVRTWWYRTRIRLSSTVTGCVKTSFWRCQWICHTLVASYVPRSCYGGMIALKKSKHQILLPIHCNAIDLRQMENISNSALLCDSESSMHNLLLRKVWNLGAEASRCTPCIYVVKKEKWSKMFEFNRLWKFCAFVRYCQNIYLFLRKFFFYRWIDF